MELYSKNLRYPLIILFTCLLLLVFTSISSAKNKNPKNNAVSANAKKELKALKIPFTKKEFLTGVKKNNLHIVKLFLSAGMNPNTRDAKTGNTALIYASLNGNITIVKLLLADNADINAKSKDGFTAMAAAVFSGHAKVMKLLKKREQNKAPKSKAKIK